MGTSFNTWIDLFVSEKGLDVETVYEVEGPEWGTNWIPLGSVVEAMKAAPAAEQRAIRDMVVKIDFRNGDVEDYFRHLAKALAL